MCIKKIRMWPSIVIHQSTKAFLPLIYSVIFLVTMHQPIALLHLSLYKQRTAHNSSVDDAECRVQKMRSVENAECRKCGVQKMRSVQNAECTKCGVYKMRSVESAECTKCGV